MVIGNNFDSSQARTTPNESSCPISTGDKTPETYQCWLQRHLSKDEVTRVHCVSELKYSKLRKIKVKCQDCRCQFCFSFVNAAIIFICVTLQETYPEIIYNMVLTFKFKLWGLVIDPYSEVVLHETLFYQRKLQERCKITAMYKGFTV